MAKVNLMKGYLLADHTWYELVITAAFIALVSFGGIGGVLLATSPQTFFGWTADLVCPRGSEMIFDEWFDGESNQFRLYCENPKSGETKERTLAALAVVMAGDFLVIFWVVWLILVVISAAQRAKRKRALKSLPPV